MLIMRRNTACLLFLCLSVSCAVENIEEQPRNASSSALEEVCFCTEIEGEEVINVKSVLPEDIETKISDVTLASYSADGSLTDARYYESGFSSMRLYVQEGSGSNIYAVVNMGDMTDAFPEEEESVQDMVYDVGSYQTVGTLGFPMSGSLTGFTFSESPGVVKVERLFSKICVRILHKSLSGYDPSSVYSYNMCNRSLYVRQANKRLLPFAIRGSRALSPLDILQSSDYNSNMNDRTAYDGSLAASQLGPGPGYFQDTTVVFYVPENMQGNLLPSNTDPYRKEYDNISDINGRSYSDLCTYLEFNARREPTIGYSGSVMYRYYLGADNTSDFNLERNKRYDLTLDFTEEGFYADSWKVTRGSDWNDKRVLEFLEEPFCIQPGGTEKVMIHYHRYGTSGSQNYPDDWSFVADESAMKAAGLTLSFDPDVLVTGKNGYKDFCVNVSASSSAKVGAKFPLKVITNDGVICDESTITVLEKTGLIPVWSNEVEYVSQEGILSFTGAVEGDLPLSVTLSDGSKVDCTRISDYSFKVVANRTGDVTVNVRNASGTKTVSVDMSIIAPVLDVSDSSIDLNPDGASEVTSYNYLDRYGKALSNVNSSAFDTYLRPVVSADGYFNSYVTSSSLRFEIGSLNVSGVRINLGRTYPAKVSAVDCQGVDPKTVALVVTDPFPDIAAGNLGSIDDYTLFASYGTVPALRTVFADEIAANASFEYQGFVPDAESQYVSVALEPEWLGRFSNTNDIFKASLDLGSGRISVKQTTLLTGAEHSAGRHNLMIYVQNRHSSEKIGRSCGTVDVYVHTAIGARAVFDSRACGYRNGGTETFASVYNTVAGQTIYPNTTSSDKIHYIDVSMEWMTDVSGVYVLGTMDNATEGNGYAFDSDKIIRPSVSDCQTLTSTRMLYSLCSTRDSRISVCGEPYRPYKGIGAVLYRALLIPAYSGTVSEINLKLWFFGWQSHTGKGTIAYAPCYELYDVLNGTTVTSRQPYHFTPSALKSYVDKSGRGYHVIHFLEKIYPDTYGWINLL